MEKNKKLLLVDDDENVLGSLNRLLKREDYIIFTANSGAQGLEILNQEEIGVVVSDMMMPEMDGLEFLRKAAKINKNLVKILLTGNATLDAAVEAINNIGLFCFSIKPWNTLVLISDINRAFDSYNLTIENMLLQEQTKRQNQELQDINQSLEDKVRVRTLLLEEAVDESILLLARAVETKDNSTEGHIYRIHDIVFVLCQELGLSDEETGKISQFSMIHDIGKLKINDSLLNKTADPTKEEMEIKQQHTIIGEEILGVKPFYKIAREIARSHHEKWDGSGYPDGLKGENIPLPARILAVAETFDVFSHKEPYKDAWDETRILEELKKLAGTKLDPEIVNALIMMCKKKTGKGIPETFEQV